MIRRAETKDIEALIRLRMALIREANAIEDKEDISELENNVIHYLNENLNRDFWAWIIEDQGEIVASSGLNLMSKPPTYKNQTGKEAFIMNIYVAPSYRGNGYATQLVNTMITYLKGTDCKKVSLVATEAGRYVYEKIGFEMKDSVMEYSL